MTLPLDPCFKDECGIGVCLSTPSCTTLLCRPAGTAAASVIQAASAAKAAGTYIAMQGVAPGTSAATNLAAASSLGLYRQAVRSSQLPANVVSSLRGALLAAADAAAQPPPMPPSPPSPPSSPPRQSLPFPPTLLASRWGRSRRFYSPSTCWGNVVLLCVRPCTELLCVQDGAIRDLIGVC